MKINIYMDMDGVQTVYDKEDSVEEMMERGYFLSRVPHENVIAFMKELEKDERYHLTILSSVFQDSHSIMEKCMWLEEQGLGSVDTLFVPCGTPKAEYVKEQGLNILIDDFSKNLFAWETAGENYIAIKFRNEVNGEYGTWKNYGGPELHVEMTAEELKQRLEGILAKLGAGQAA